MSDNQKRTAFSIRFSVLGLTDSLVDTVMDETIDWHQFTDTLRKRLVRRGGLEKRDSRSAKLTQTSPNPSEPPENDDGIRLFLAATLEDGWKVGDTLWKHLTREQRSKLISMRKEAMSQKNPFSQGGRSEPQK